MHYQDKKRTNYSQFACIGSGFSAIGLGATLKRWHNITDIVFFERHDQLGGTWTINRYPGNLANQRILLNACRLTATGQGLLATCPAHCIAFLSNQTQIGRESSRPTMSFERI